jgi:uncharacterized membrane protein (DUF4010 family)
MLPRMLLVASIVNAELFDLVLVPAVVMSAIIYLPGIFYWHSKTSRMSESETLVKNPLDVKAALTFGLLLALVLLLGKALQNWFGDAGVLALAAASGISDVDAITLSLARMSQDDLALRTAAAGIVIAAAVNSLAKACIAAAIGGRAIGLRAGLPLFCGAGAGLVTVWLWL